MAGQGNSTECSGQEAPHKLDFFGPNVGHSLAETALSAALFESTGLRPGGSVAGRGASGRGSLANPVVQRALVSRVFGGCVSFCFCFYRYSSGLLWSCPSFHDFFWQGAMVAPCHQSLWNLTGRTMALRRGARMSKQPVCSFLKSTATNLQESSADLFGRTA